MSFGLSENLLTHIKSIFNEEETVVWVKIYGSRALGQFRDASDIDLAFSSLCDDFLESRLKAKLELLPTALKFDVTHYEHISHLPLREHIDTKGIILFEKDSEII